MKRIFIFILSFILLFSRWKIGSGVLLTLFHIPNMESAWENNVNLSSEVILTSGENAILLSLFMVLLVAAIAYFTARKFPKRENNAG